MITALAFEELPNIVSPLINLSCDEIYNLLFVKSSARTVEVAFEVWPVIVSPLVNLPKAELSNITLSPESNCVLSEPKPPASNNNKFSWLVSVSNNIPSVVWILVTCNSADSINVKYIFRNFANCGWSSITKSGNWLLMSVEILSLNFAIEH